MERPILKLVTAAPTRSSGVDAALLGLAILLVAVVSTIVGADAARRPFDAASVAESALAETLAEGDPQPVHKASELLRARLRRRPLDSGSRVIAASLIVETATTPPEFGAAASQALAAIRSTPVDAHVAHGVARVLARCGRSDLVIQEIAHMFEFDPDEAAAALAAVEPFLSPDQLEDAIQATPDAWLAWSNRLRMQGRDAEADARLADLLARWPDDLPALGVAASAAASRDRVDELARLVPPARSLPETVDAAPLFAYRARTKAAARDAAGASADARHAVALSGGQPWVMALAGDALVNADPEAARDYWTRALYRLSAKSATGNEAVWLRQRLARLDDRQGRAGDALREWRTILAARPDDAEAKRRVQELTGESSR